VRWATGSDVSAARQLKLAREEITLLGAEKGRLTSEYERALSDVRSKFIEAQSRVELQDRSLKEKDDAAKAIERAAAEEKAVLARALRAATTRAEVAETAAESASSECTVWNPLKAAAKTTGAKVGSWARGAGEAVGAASGSVAKEAAEVASSARDKLGQLREAAPGVMSDVSAVTRRLLAEMTASQKEGADFTTYPVG